MSRDGVRQGRDEVSVGGAGGAVRDGVEGRGEAGEDDGLGGQEAGRGDADQDQDGGWLVRRYVGGAADALELRDAIFFAATSVEVPTSKYGTLVRGSVFWHLHISFPIP